MRLALPILLAATILASVFFYLAPDLDLYISGLFYHDGFALQKGNPAALLTDLVHYGMRGIVFLLAGVAGLLLVLGKAPDWLTWRRYLFVLMSIGLTAGLMTNVILKDHWGRARPNQIVQFGGTKRFTPAWVVSDQCGKNCSFVGGDVSFAFSLLAVAMLVQHRRLLWVCLVIAFGSLIAVARMAAGGHFLSDCVLAALLTATVIQALYECLIFHNIYYAIKSKLDRG